MIEHTTIKISGVVQGVFFRVSAKEKADDLGLKGFVRNEPDGTVYMEAEGTRQKLDEFIKWCWKGPAHANVTHVEVRDALVQNYEEFTIVRY
jgi:acylphosphatase